MRLPSAHNPERAPPSAEATPNHKAHYDSGLAYIRWEHWLEAAQEFQQELSRYPGDPEAQYHLGFVYVQQSRLDEAAQLFEQVIADIPTTLMHSMSLAK